jgi:hypothetical protein
MVWRSPDSQSPVTPVSRNPVDDVVRSSAVQVANSGQAGNNWSPYYSANYGSRNVADDAATVRGGGSTVGSSGYNYIGGLQGGTNYDPAAQAAGLQNQLASLYAQQAAAVRRAGSGAAGAYNAAIAKIQEAIDKIAAAQALVPGLFDEANTYVGDAVDTADSVIGDIAGANKVAIDEYAAKGEAQIHKAYSDGQGRIAKTMETLGADAGTSAFVADMVGEIEGDIVSWNEVNKENALRVSAAVTRVASAAARLVGADSAFELKKNEVTIEQDLKAKMDSLKEQKASTLAARSRAVSAARSQAAAQWSAVIDRFRYPVGDDYLQYFTDSYMSSVRQQFNLGDDDMQALSALIPDMANIFHGEDMSPDKQYYQIRWLMSDDMGIARLAGYDKGTAEGLKEAFRGLTPKELDTYAMIIADGIKLQFDQEEHYNNLGSPTQYPLGSVDHAAASYKQDSMFLPVDSGTWWNWYDDNLADMLAASPIQYTPLYTPSTPSISSVSGRSGVRKVGSKRMGVD